MATTIQFLRSDVPQQRPDPGVLANGTPMVNTFEDEPGLFFAARDGSLFKIGPASVGIDAPNSFPQGQPGNCLGELWIDTSGTNPDLKFYDGSTFVSAFTAPAAVTSVGLIFSDLFTVLDSPITGAGTLTANLTQQSTNHVFAGPASGAGGVPTFRPLESADIPGISASKVVSGTFDSGRIPSLDTSKITSGTFTDARIPNLNAAKITSGVFGFTVGGTGISSTPQDGELLIGNSTGWSKSTLTAGSNISIVNGSGSLTIGVSSLPVFQSLQVSDPGGDTITLSAPAVTVPYTLKLPASDGTNGALLTTDGAGQLTFQTSLFGLGSIGGAASLTINAGGANGDVILAPTGSGVISASSSRISNLATPTGSTDAATKAYVDTIAAGIQPKAQVAAASTANIDLATGGLLTIDTVPLSAGQRVLVKNQNFPEENGIYDVGLGAWTRSSDANTFAELVNATVFVAGGATNLGRTYLCNSPSGGTIGVDPVNWVVFSSGLGTVTSVGLSMPADFTVTNSPVTSSGTLTATYVNQTANTVFAGPSGGGAATPSFRTLTAADIPSSLNSHTFTGIATFQNSADFQGAATFQSTADFQDAVTLGSTSADVITVNGTTTFKNGTSFEGGVDLGNGASDLISINGTIDTDVLPLAVGTCNLGGPSNKWANVYTNDLHLSNEGHANDVDGTWGSYTIQEGEDSLYLINRRSGKRYKFLLQEV